MKPDVHAGRLRHAARVRQEVAPVRIILGNLECKYELSADTAGQSREPAPRARRTLRAKVNPVSA